MLQGDTRSHAANSLSLRLFGVSTIFSCIDDPKTILSTVTWKGVENKSEILRILSALSSRMSSSTR